MAVFWPMWLICLLPIIGATKSQQECGKTSQSELPALVSDTVQAPVRAWPWLAQIQYRLKHHCAAAIINRHWLLTAAHCFDVGGNVPFDYSALIGQYDRTVYDQSESRLPVESVEIHPGYKVGRESNDIALVRLLIDIGRYDQNVQPICRPQNLEDHDRNSSQPNVVDRRCFTASWSDGSKPRGHTKTVHHLEGQILTKSDCDEQWNGQLARDIRYKTKRSFPLSRSGRSNVYHPCSSGDRLLGDETNRLDDLLRELDCKSNWAYDSKIKITAGQLCFANPTKSSCMGDSGTPMMCTGGPGQPWQLEGILSFASDECRKAGVFTKVSEYSDWIDEVINRFSRWD